MKNFFDIIPPKIGNKKTLMKTPIRIIYLLIIITLSWVGFLTMGKTVANFLDIEISEGNNFSVGALDFSLHSGQSNFVPETKSLNMEPGDEVNRVIQIRGEGSFSFQYTAQTEKISGDDDFCNALQLVADLEGQEIYQGSLMDFSFSPVEISDSIDTWHFKVSLPEGSNFENKTCQIKFVFDGWQINPPGFFDQEEIESYFASTLASSSDSSNNPHSFSEGSTTNEEIINEITQSEIIGETAEPSGSSSDVQTGEQPISEEGTQSEEPSTPEESTITEPTIEEQPATGEENNSSAPAEDNSSPVTTPEETSSALPDNIQDTSGTVPDSGTDSSSASEGSNSEAGASSGETGSGATPEAAPAGEGI